MRNKKIVLTFFAILFIANISAWLIVSDLSRVKFLEVSFFSVGQGEAAFIETPGQQQILIDGGPSSAVLEKLGREMPFWDRTIDLMILTHPEQDHLSGLLEVLKKYKVENILWTGALRDTAEFKEWQKLIQTERANIFIAKAGQKIKMAKSDIDILFPFESQEGKFLKDSNDSSIVSQLVSGGIKFLFTGDISKTVEKEILGNDVSLGSDILKISHHGSKNSSEENFIKMVLPKIAVISAGINNQYGHPAAETLETLEKYGIDILRTDLNGDIKIITNGKKYVISFNQN